MMKKTKLLRTIIALAMAVTLFAGFGMTAIAAETDGTVTVSVTYGNFDTAGNYTGDGFTNANFYIEDYELDIDYVQEMVDYGLKESVYLPDPSDDNLDGEASILDAIILAFWDNEYYDVYGGWDYAPEEGLPGGYISDVPPDYFEYDIEPAGGDYVREWGYSWQIAYADGGSISASDVYDSNVALEDGMTIIFDYSAFDRTFIAAN